MAYRYRRSNLTAPAAEVTSLWTIWWDMHRRAGTDGWSRATEPTQDEALQRTERFLKLGFVVYAIWDPRGVIFMDEAQIAERFGRSAIEYSDNTPEQRSS
jgi:hypothetical protein